MGFIKFFVGLYDKFKLSQAANSFLPAIFVVGMGAFMGRVVGALLRDQRARELDRISACKEAALLEQVRYLPRWGCIAGLVVGVVVGVVIFVLGGLP